jgi:DUF4097 and DUF4098 domain-containing protein YvlB
MPSFDTPAPITATLELMVGDVRVTATDRGDTVVEVRPSDAAVEADVRAAAETRVEFANGKLLVKTPKRLRVLGPFAKDGSVDVEIALPSGSHLHADAAMSAFHCTGRLGDCRIRTATGDLSVERTATLDVTTAAGTIVVEHVAGDAKATTATGTVSLGDVGGRVTVKNSSGPSRIGTAGGEVKVKSANGDIVVEHAGGGVDAATAAGSVRVLEVRRGAVNLRTAAGELEVGVAVGTAVYLDLNTSFGKVLNELDSTGAPGPGELSVEVHARTSFGDILVHRSAGTVAA